MEPLHALAEKIGIIRNWRTVDGVQQTVSDKSLAIISTALGYPAHSKKEVAASLKQAEIDSLRVPSMLVAEAGKPISLPASLVQGSITLPDGTSKDLDVSEWVLPPIETAGYYPLTFNGHQFTLAVAPRKCPSVHDLGKGRIWGPALQIPALRSKDPQHFGSFSELAEAVECFAELGADAIAINPVHALFSGYGENFSPYSPSSRLFLNSAMGAPTLLGLPALPPVPQDEVGASIDWSTALPQRLAQLRDLFAKLDDKTLDRIAKDNAPYGESLKRQALYDALDVHFRKKGLHSWQNWPASYRDPSSEAVAHFAKKQKEEVNFHLFTQWLSRESMAVIQTQARSAGMGVGLLADLAVGVHTGGADAWSFSDALLQGLTIGAPPDPLGPLGQNWNLTSFSPQGLAKTGYAPWIKTIRSALATSGALRIDHAFGLARLWVVPEGRASSEGAYLTYPFHDLIRLVALEAHLADAFIVAEDLGTMPFGFGTAISEIGMLGMRVLWFQRAEDEGFIGSQDYEENAVAMTGTHDTATIAGWWSGRDLDWAEKLDRLPQNMPREHADAQRAWDRGLLWASLTHDASPRPKPYDVSPVVEAALHFIGSTPSRLAIIPMEDLLAEKEQPNLPGTVTEHPNWRYRLNAPLSELLAHPDVRSRIATINNTRKN